MPPGSPTRWKRTVSGHDGAVGGIHVQGQPALDTPAYQEGSAPSINFLDYANGTLGDWGIHWMDQILWVTGAKYPKRVYSAGGRAVKECATAARFHATGKGVTPNRGKQMDLLAKACLLGQSESCSTPVPTSSSVPTTTTTSGSTT